jgi:hypothetical protein
MLRKNKKYYYFVSYFLSNLNLKNLENKLFSKNYIRIRQVFVFILVMNNIKLTNNIFFKNNIVERYAD